MRLGLKTANSRLLSEVDFSGDSEDTLQSPDQMCETDINSYRDPQLVFRENKTCCLAVVLQNREIGLLERFHISRCTIVNAEKM